MSIWGWLFISISWFIIGFTTLYSIYKVIYQDKKK